MTEFDYWVGHTVSIEGGLSLDPDDNGNWTGGKKGSGLLKGTKFGISAASFPDEDIANLTEERAKAIYKTGYWDRCKCDSMPSRIAFLTFDCAVNCGVGTAGKVLQRVLNNIIRDRLKVDGAIGPKTLAALNRALAHCTEEELLGALLLERMKEHADIVGRHPDKLKWLRGWLLRLYRLKELVEV